MGRYAKVYLDACIVMFRVGHSYTDICIHSVYTGFLAGKYLMCHNCLPYWHIYWCTPFFFYFYFYFATLNMHAGLTLLVHTVSASTLSLLNLRLWTCKLALLRHISEVSHTISKQTRWLQTGWNGDQAVRPWDKEAHCILLPTSSRLGVSGLASLECMVIEQCRYWTTLSAYRFGEMNGGCFAVYDAKCVNYMKVQIQRTHQFMWDFAFTASGF